MHPEIAPHLSMREEMTEEELELHGYVAEGIMSEIYKAKAGGYPDETIASNGAMYAVWAKQKAEGKSLTGIVV